MKRWVMRTHLFKSITILGTMLALIIAACGGTADPGYQIVAPASIGPTEAIPAPSGEEVLVISGLVAAKNDGDALSFDIATLERLGLVEYSVQDPWLKDTFIYTGVFDV